MGFGSSFKKSLGGVVSKLPGGSTTAALLGGGLLGFAGKNSFDDVTTAALAGVLSQSALESFNRSREKGGQAPVTQEQLTAANVFRRLSPEQQKDILINNPNIITSQGKQIFDPLTNTIRLEESEFQKGQRGRQEQLAAGLSGQLIGQDLPGTDPASRFESGRELLAPAFEEQRERLEQQLADQGIPRGSEAHQKELDRLERSQGTQLSALARESVQTTEAQRAARFNEISSLLGQQQVGGVGFGGFQPSFSGTDVLGFSLSQQQLQAQGIEAKRARDAAKRQALVQGLGQLGSTAAMAFSDSRLKENIERVGESESGIPIYRFEYINKGWSPDRFEGVMAQDLIKLKPEAIIHTPSGLMAVDYSKLDVEFRRVN